MEAAYIGVGSNLGDREGYLALALDRLALISPGRLRCSPVYESAPWGVPDQPNYLNCVVEMECALEPEALLDRLQVVESSAGAAVKSPRWGARTLDLDILLFGGRVYRSARLVIPHPELLRRRFVLIPLCDLAPRLMIPGAGITVAEAARVCPDSGLVKPYVPRSL